MEDKRKEKDSSITKDFHVNKLSQVDNYFPPRKNYLRWTIFSHQEKII